MPSEMPERIALPAEVVRLYLASVPRLAGRMPLLGSGYEQHGPTLTTLASYAHPLIFEADIEGTEYGIAGTCFLGRYKGELFVITAGHCLCGSNGNDVRIALNPETKSFLPLSF